MSGVVAKQSVTALVLVLVASASPVSLRAQPASSFCTLGEEKWMEACEVRCTASWSGPRRCSDSCTATAPPGWMIVNHRIRVVSQSNGGHSISKLGIGQKLEYKRTLEDAYSYALDLAGKKNLEELKANIREDANSSLREVEQFASTHQAIRLTVNANRNGSAFDRKRGWSEVRAQMLCRCFAPKNLQDQIARKYGLQ